MAKARSLVGLDVHAAKIVAAVLDADTGELKSFAMNGETRRRPGSAPGCRDRSGSRMRPDRPGTRSRASSRSGGLSAWSRRRRRSRARPGTGSRPIARDAEHLARLLLAGKLHPVRVPGPEEEALRDLVRARETLRLDLMRARHRLSKMLMRHGVAVRRRAGVDRPASRMAEDRVTWSGRRRRATLLDLRRRRSTRWSTAASTWSGRSSRSCPARRGRCRSAGCGACAVWTR